MVAEIKTIRFYEGLATVAPDQTLPLTVGDATTIHHALALGQLAALIAAQALSVTGTDAAPTSVTAAGGVTFSGSSLDNLKYINSNSGAVVISANPQIAVGTFVGQKLRLVFKSATDTLQLSNGNGLLMDATFVSGLDREMHLNWNGSVWREYYRK